MILEWFWFSVLTIAGGTFIDSYFYSENGSRDIDSEAWKIPAAVFAYAIAVMLFWSIGGENIGTWLTEFIPKPGTFIHVVTGCLVLALATAAYICGSAALQMLFLKKLRNSMRIAG